jgi:predicted TPR repeat methyltransferase
MRAIPRSSGDLVADRRYAYAMDLKADGRPAEAAELIEQALERVPDWAEGWMALSQAREAAGDAAGAAAALERARASDPFDRLGAALHLARLGAAAAPEAPPAAYVRDLFDAYADDFETALVGKLGYDGPRRIVAALEEAAPGRRFTHGIDLGCGTGLMAAALAGRVARLDGVDLSAAMVARARAKNLYAELRVGEIVADLAAGGATYDLILAADVFCYLGDLEPVLTAARARATAGAVLGFSVERGASGIALADSLRYAHGADYLTDTLVAAGWRDARFTPATLRHDRGQALAGLFVIASAG